MLRPTGSSLQAAEIGSVVSERLVHALCHVIVLRHEAAKAE